MGKSWDSSGVTFQSETWEVLAEILHPGAFLMVFAGSRGWHRLACAMEDANLILQPTIFIWLNSQSFPKASRIRKAPQPERARRYRWFGWLGKLGNWLLRKRGKPPRYYLDFVWGGHRYGGQVLKDCATPVICAQVPWEEPRRGCIVRTGAGAINVDAGRIASGGDVAKTSPSHSVSDGWDRPWRHDEKMAQRTYEAKLAGNIKAQTQGRWPSNFCLVHRAPSPDGSGGCVRAGTKDNSGAGLVHHPPETQGTSSHPCPAIFEEVDAWRCAEGCPARKLGEMSGERPGGRPITNPHAESTDAVYRKYPSGRSIEGSGRQDSGTAARYYHQSGWERERAEMRCARDCPVKRLGGQSGESKSVRSMRGDLVDNRGDNYGRAEGKRIPNSNYMRGHDDEGTAARFFHNADWHHEIAERLATGDPVRYCPKAAKRERSSGLDDFYWRKDKASPTGFVRVSREEWEALGEEEKRVKAETGKRVSLRARGNIHVALKPISLCKWLASLLLPPAEYAPRRIVIPFCGTFSEGIGAMLAGWDEVVGVDFIREYVDIAEARAAFWQAQPRQLELET